VFFDPNGETFLPAGFATTSPAYFDGPVTAATAARPGNNNTSKVIDTAIQRVDRARKTRVKDPAPPIGPRA
jgi:hypothetical protein